ncbi:MAG TPA: GNAT family N-acetyltransferase [Actinomycetes bacterium]|nr:GNAT family N-acetyltransferase [Actinomycetes bacterium]
MAVNAVWPSAEVIYSSSLVMEPLRVDHADEVASALDDPELHAYIGGEPATAEELRSRFAIQVVGQSPDGSEGWLNWVLRDAASQQVVGTVQATLTQRPEGMVAAFAWTVGTPWQGQGTAKEAAKALSAWLLAQGAVRQEAHVHPDHAASAAIARAVGMQPTADLVDGEVRWVLRTS